MKTFKVLKDYVTSKMKMSHIYQPLMIMELIRGNGKSNGKKIAKAFLNYDQTQIDYYRHITKLMPFKYLSKHMKEFKRDKDNYYIENYDLSFLKKRN